MNGGSLCVDAVGEQVRQHGVIVGEDGVNAGACCPLLSASGIHSRPRLVGWVPGSTVLAAVGGREGADIACDLLPFFIREAVEHTADDDGGVGVVEVLEVSSVGGMAVPTVRLNGRGTRKAIQLQRGVLPKRLAGSDIVGVVERWLPGGGVVLGKHGGGQHVAAIGVAEVEV